MNLRPVSIDGIPLNRPMPWRLYDRNGYILFARGEMVNSREQLVNLLPDGLLRDVDVPPQPLETGDWAEFKETAPVGVFPPSGIKPQIGERVQLRLLNQSLPTYYSTRLIGYIKNQSILLTRPVTARNPPLLQEGGQAEVRMVTGNNIYAYLATIQHLCVTPANYLHLSWPAEVHVQKLRKSPWARMNLGVTVTDAQGAHEAARLVNLSPDGAQLLAQPGMGEPGEAVRLSFHVAMDELKTTLNLDATILHTYAPRSGRRESEANMLEYGIAFRNLTAADALWLKGLVYQHIAEGFAA